MATLKSVWGHTPRPWGYEVRVDFTDDATGAIHNEVMTFKAEPSTKELDAAVIARKVSLESRIAVEAIEAAKPPEPTVEVLKAKVAMLEAEKTVLIAEKIALNVQLAKVVK
jgi:hypothetical protein